MINPMTLENKRIIITGAASGIGRETAVLMSKLGAELLLIDLNKDGLLETNRICEDKSKIMELNLLDVDAMKKQITEDAKMFGKFSGFVHLAGIPYISPLKVINTNKAFDVYKINAYTAIELSKIFTSNKVYCGDGGSIVLISSVYGIVGSAANVAYSMSKAAIIGATKSLAIELAPKGIRVNCVAPGFIKTKMKENIDGYFSEEHDELVGQMHPLGWGEAIDIANAIAFLMSNAAKWVTGAVFNIDGGFTAQ